MTSRYQVYKCEKCENVVMVLTAGEGELVCCGEPMKLMEAQTAEMSTEKHVPVVEKVDGGYKVVVGSTIHPMTEEHYIEWISLCSENKTHFAFLEPNQKPEAFFKMDEEPVEAYEYCNIHGLWVNKEI